jgi:hypothetical protein
MFILGLHFSSKTHVFVTHILIGCSYCLLHPVKTLDHSVTMKILLTWQSGLGRDYMVIKFTTTCAISAYHHYETMDKVKEQQS